METERCVELSWAMGDSVSMKLNFLVNVLGISDPTVINDAVRRPETFHDIFKKSKSKGDIVS